MVDGGIVILQPAHGQGRVGHGGRETVIELIRLYIYDEEKMELSYDIIMQVIEGVKDPAAVSHAQYLLGEYYYLKKDYKIHYLKKKGLSCPGHIIV